MEDVLSNFRSTTNMLILFDYKRKWSCVMPCLQGSQLTDKTFDQNLAKRKPFGQINLFWLAQNLLNFGQLSFWTKFANLQFLFRPNFFRLITIGITSSFRCLRFEGTRAGTRLSGEGGAVPATVHYG